MAIGRAVLQIKIAAQDSASRMIDAVGTSTDRLARSWGQVSIQANNARRRLAGFSQGATDIKSMTSLMGGLFSSVQSYIEAQRQQRIEGEKAINVTRSLQMAIGDTTEVIQQATDATRGLVTQTELEVLIRKFSGLGIPLKDAVSLLESATRLAMSADKKVPEVAEALLGAMTGRMSTLAKTFGVAIEGVEPTAKSLAAAIERALGGEQLDAFITRAQVLETTAANIQSNIDAVRAKGGAASFLPEFLSDPTLAKAEKLGRSLFGLDVLEETRKAYDLTAEHLKKTAGATEDQIAAFGTSKRIQREITKQLADQAEKIATGILPAQKAIRATLEHRLKLQSGATELELQLAQNMRQTLELEKSLGDDTTANRKIHDQINAALEQRLDLTAQIKAEEQAIAPILALNKKLAEIAKAKPTKRRGQAPELNAATASDMAARWGIPELSAAPMADAFEAAQPAILRLQKGHARAKQRHLIEAAAAETQILLAGIGNNYAALVEAHQAQVDLKAQQAAELRQIAFDAAAELDAIDEENKARELERWQTHAGRLEEAMLVTTRAFMNSGRTLAPMEQALAASGVAAAAMVTNFDALKDGAPKAIAAIGQVTASAVADERARAGIMASFVLAESIFQFLKTGSTRYDLLAMGVTAAGLYGVSAFLPGKASAGAAGTTGAGSTPTATPITADSEAGGGFTVNFYSNAPIITGGAQSGGAELAALAIGVAGTGMQQGGAV